MNHIPFRFDFILIDTTCHIYYTALQVELDKEAEQRMSDWGVGFAIGIAVGLIIGLIAGRRQKPWSELTDKEKKIRMGIIAILAISFIAGIVVFFLV